MQKEICNIIVKLAEDVMTKIPKGFEKRYYSKMSYSNQNDMLQTDDKTLNLTISFEVAFVHIVLWIMNQYLSDKKYEYSMLLEGLDRDDMFSWYKIDDSFVKEYLSSMKCDEITVVQDLINQHDTFIDKNIKKKLGQFYTPQNIVKSMILEIKEELKTIRDDEYVVDPACGTGVFLIELLGQIDSYEKINLFIDINLYAYDANPFAVIATRINIVVLLLARYSQKRKEIVEYIFSEKAFRNIKWKNTIVELDERSYMIILGNPPYFKLNSKMMKDIEGYDDIIYGQPNIYTLFMYWAIRHLNEDGIMSLIIPQSIRSGLYFKNIRAQIKNLRIKSLVNISSRQNLFDRAEQAVLIICLENKPILNAKTKIQFYNRYGKIDTQFKIPCSKIMLDEENNNVFILSKNKEMYEIYDKILHNSQRLQTDLYPQKFSNGLFVWNQHKDDIVEKEQGTAPIIYGGNVQPVNFNFSVCSSNDERKQFARVNEKTNPYVVTGKRLLVQRTTNFDKDIRLKACVITDDFLNCYDTYFLENHVNFLCSEQGKNNLVNEKRLYFFLGLLNSKILNCVFVSKSGNTQVSANELNLLPYPLVGEDEISEFVRRYEKELLMHQNELDDLICTSYGLSSAEKKLIIKK